MLTALGGAPCPPAGPACRGGSRAFPYRCSASGSVLARPGPKDRARPIFPVLPAGSLSFNEMSEHKTTLLGQPANELTVSSDSPSVWGYLAYCEGKTGSDATLEACLEAAAVQALRSTHRRGLPRTETAAEKRPQSRVPASSVSKGLLHTLQSPKRKQSFLLFLSGGQKSPGREEACPQPLTAEL